MHDGFDVLQFYGLLDAPLRMPTTTIGANRQIFVSNKSYDGMSILYKVRTEFLADESACSGNGYFQLGISPKQ